MIMGDKIINHVNDQLSHACPITATGQFIIPTNHVLGDSAYQRVLDQLKILKQQKRQKQKEKKAVEKQMENTMENRRQMKMGTGIVVMRMMLRVRVFGLILGD